MVNGTETAADNSATARPPGGGGCYQRRCPEEDLSVTTRPGAGIRVFRPFAILTVALCALTATLVHPVSAETPRKMAAQATPSTNLGDEVVNVTREGFHPTMNDGTYGVVILQCRAHPRWVERDCTTAETFPFDLNGNQQAGITNAAGTGSVFMDIMTTARLPSLACSQSTPCSLMLYEVTADGFDPNSLPPATTRVIQPLSLERNS